MFRILTEKTLRLKNAGILVQPCTERVAAILLKVKRRCSLKTLISASLLVIFIINILVYFLVDIGGVLNHIENDSPDQVFKTKTPTILPIVEKKKEEMKKPSPLVKAAKQKRFYFANGPGQRKASIKAANRIFAVEKELKNIFVNSTKDDPRLSALLQDLIPTNHLSQDLWSVAEKWVTGQSVIPVSAPLLGSVLNVLCSSKIVKASNSKKGTQLKMQFTLEGGHEALFKPQWYKREEVISGSVYSGKDRHNAEVAAFHLSLLLDLRRVPLTVGRKVDLRREVMPVATPDLKETFFQEGNSTCFYGVCLYCNPSDPVCGRGNIMEGALILWLPSRLQFAKYAHPWQRSYRKDYVARWEVEEDYCDKVKKAKHFASKYRLLDLIDAAIFDFLISNGDRHHYEAPINLEPSSVFLFDNGKSFGDPNSDHLDILSPLYQCCIIRRQTWERLLLYQGGGLSESLEKLLRLSHIAPVLTKDHLLSLDRRLLLALAAVHVCIRDKGEKEVIV